MTMNAAASIALPRGVERAADARDRVRGLLRASLGSGVENTEAAVAIRQLTAGVEAFKAKFEGKLAEFEEHMDAQSKSRVGALVSGAGQGGLPSDPAYASLFASYFRRGGNEAALEAAQATGTRGEVRAAMSEGSNSDGGYIAPVEWDRQIRQAQVIISPMRRIAQIVQTKVGAFSTVWNGDSWGSGWVGETASRPQTSTPTLSTLTFSAGEIYAQPAATQRLLDDGLVDVEKWMADQVSTEFDRQEGIAFVSGDGVNKPRGLLTYVAGGASDGQHPGGNLDVIASGAAAAITADALVDFFYGLAAPYRQNAVWTMSSTTAGAIGKLKDGQGNYLWRDAFLANQPPTLLGRPVVMDENMPPVAAGNMPLAFGDFNAGYLINDRTGTRILRDPFTAKPYVLFYVTRRVGAGVLNPRAIRLMKIAAS